MTDNGASFRPGGDSTDAGSRELERRTKTLVSDSIGYQLVRCGPSVGANYREANRAESHDDFIHTIGIIEKEASETC